MAETPETEVTVTVTMTLRQASLTRGALMAYRSAIEHVSADLRPMPSAGPTLDDLQRAKFAVEEGMEEVNQG